MVKKHGELPNLVLGCSMQSNLKLCLKQSFVLPKRGIVLVVCTPWSQVLFNIAICICHFARVAMFLF